MNLNLHKILYLYKTPSKFFIQPAEQPNEALIIDRQTCEISLNCMFNVGQLPANATSSLIYGIIGIKHLINCPYLIVITKATQIGSIDLEPIYKLDQAQIIPFDDNHNLEPRSGQNDWNNTYVNMLECILKMPYFYFSYTYDITNTLQRNFKLKTQHVGFRTHHNYDKRFQWNSHVMNDFDACDDITNRYRLPFILGFISINSIPINGGREFVLISRRSIKRAGTRFNCRGIDEDGNVSNFVETEQIISLERVRQFSFVQVRGSIPLKWSQKPTYKYMPAMKIDTNFNHIQAMEKHFKELDYYYRGTTIVNLVNSTGDEGNLAREYGGNIHKLKQIYNHRGPINYHYFDFHKECSKLRWNRLNILLEKLENEINLYGYCCIDFPPNHAGPELVKEQIGVIRVNCVDSLDRTNVVQSMIAQYVIDLILPEFPVYSALKLKSDHHSLNVFKNVWADNADALSIQYTGTPALKTDFTRTGQRTAIGVLNDGVNAVTRYVSNNYLDYYRQDAIDLFLGHYEGWPSPLYRPLDMTTYTSTLPVTIVMLTFVILYLYLRY